MLGWCCVSIGGGNKGNINDFLKSLNRGQWRERDSCWYFFFLLSLSNQNPLNGDNWFNRNLSIFNLEASKMKIGFIYLL